MSKARCKIMADKSLEAALAAIEIYNKPDAKYREESFVILLINAWELLLKARILSVNNHKLTSIYVKQSETAKQPRYKRNRIGNPLTVELRGAMKILNVAPALQAQITVLIDMRDNATHFYVDQAVLNKKIYEVGVASLRSYARLLEDWFSLDISRYNWYILPVSFVNVLGLVEANAGSTSDELSRLLDAVHKAEQTFPSSPQKAHNVSLSVGIRFKKSQSDTAALVQTTKPGTEGAVTIAQDDEEQFKQNFKWSFKDDLYPELQRRYSNLKQDAAFWEIKRELEKDSKFARQRMLDPNKPKSGKKWFYSPNCLHFFDKHYSRHAATD